MKKKRKLKNINPYFIRVFFLAKKEKTIFWESVTFFKTYFLIICKTPVKIRSIDASKILIL